MTRITMSYVYFATGTRIRYLLLEFTTRLEGSVHGYRRNRVANSVAISVAKAVADCLLSPRSFELLIKSPTEASRSGSI